MPYTIQANFTAGELSPVLEARTDIEEYNKGAATLKNFIVHPQGGISSRPGTAYLANFADTAHRLYTFEYSTEQAYCLVFINLKMYVLMDGGVVQTGGGADYYLTTTYATADLPNLKFTQSADVLYVTHPSYPPREIARTADNAWTITTISFDEDPYEDRTLADNYGSMTVADLVGSNKALATTGATPFKSGMVGRTCRLGSVNLEDVSVVKWGVGRIDTVTNSASARCDIISPLGGNMYPDGEFKEGQGAAAFAGQGSGTVTVSWYYAGQQLRLQNLMTHGSYLGWASGPVNFDLERPVTVYFSATRESDGFTTSGKLLGVQSAAGSTTTPGVGGTYLGIEYVGLPAPGATVTGSFDTTPSKSHWLSFFIAKPGGVTAFTASIKVNYIIVSFCREKTSTYWRVPAFHSADYYPGVCGFYEQRLVLGASPQKPQSLWHSKTGGYYDFGFHTPLEDDDSFSYTIAAGDVNAIEWICPIKEMLVGTKGGIWQIWGGANSNSMTPYQKVAKKKYGVGAAKNDPIVIGESLFYIERGKTRIQEISYSLQEDEFNGHDVTIASAHLFEDKTIVDWAYARTPDSIIWCVLSDGTLAGLTIDKSAKVYAWHRHETQGSFKNVCVVPSDSGDDDVYFVVSRAISGGTKYCVEHMQPRISDVDSGDWWTVDCGISYNSSSAALTVSGLDHLDGVTASILADGGVCARQAPVSGDITLSNSASVIIAGLKYTQEFNSLALDLRDNSGTMQGRLKNVPAVTFSVYKTKGFWAGPDSSSLQMLQFREPDSGSSVPLFTGEKEIGFDSDNKSSIHVYVKNEDPTPVTIRAIIPEIRAFEDEGG